MECPNDIISLKGIGEKTAKLFYRMGIHTTEELLFHYPKDYQVFEMPIKASQAQDGALVTIELFLPAAFSWKRCGAFPSAQEQAVTDRTGFPLRILTLLT